MEQCFCGAPVPVSSTGRPAQYCCPAHRQQAYRQRVASVTKLAVMKLPEPAEDIRFYCGVNNAFWHHHPVVPGDYACVAPTYGKTVGTKRLNQVAISKDVRGVLMDSAAFSDGPADRLSFDDALDRQIAHAYRFHYIPQVSHVASYDWLVDEKSKNGQRYKERWSREEAEHAVKVTVDAARFLAAKRQRIQQIFGHPVGLVLSAQGVDVEQYLRCAEQLVPLMEEGDILGLGGWCITGLLPKVILPSFRDIMAELIPFLGRAGVPQVHIWGVIFPEALATLLAHCQDGEKAEGRSPIKVSTDSSGPYRYPIMGEWGYGSWRQNGYKVAPILPSCRAVDEAGHKAPTCAPDSRCQGLESTRHVALTRAWLAHFREQEPALYQQVLQLIEHPPTRYEQLAWTVPC